jgi:hypothetical protein
MQHQDIFYITYQTAPNQDVLLSEIVGSAQMGTSSLTLNGVDLGTGTFDNFNLGSSLAGQRLSMKTIVSNVKSAAKNLVVTHELIGGQIPFVEVRHLTTAGDGDAVVFLLHVDFH